jgi:hypothetical protein
MYLPRILPVIRANWCSVSRVGFHSDSTRLGGRWAMIVLSLTCHWGSADLFALPAAQGCAAIFDACKALKMQESGNRAFLLSVLFLPERQ